MIIIISKNFGLQSSRIKSSKTSERKRQEIYQRSNTYATWYACAHLCSPCKKSRELFNKNVQMVYEESKKI
uniref:Uncharacterized protein n=1 Tax=Glossina palpalis gambiensis TaxID=67801 RepID=A0A1B0ASD9_9MUSC